MKNSAIILEQDGRYARPTRGYKSLILLIKLILHKSRTYCWLGSSRNKPTHYAVTRKFTLLFVYLRKVINHKPHIKDRFLCLRQW